MWDNGFEIPYKVLTWLGLWNIESGNSWLRKFYFVYQSSVLFSLLIIINFCFWDLYFVRMNVHKASTNLSATLSVFMVLWKNTQALQKYPEIRQLRINLSRGLRQPRDAEQEAMSRRAEKGLAIFSILVYLVGGFTTTCWLLSGIYQSPTDGRVVMPLPMWVPWDYQKPPYYGLGILFQAHAGYLVTFDVLTINLTIFVTIIQICTEYDILRRNVQKINWWHMRMYGPLLGVRMLTEEENKEVQKMFAENIQHHQKIIKSVKAAEKCYVHMMLVQFGGSALLMTVITLDLILLSAEINSRLVTLIFFLFSVTADIFFFCYYGTHLLNKGHQYLEALYELPWEVMDPKNRKILSILIMNAQKPPKLTVENFADIDFYSLLKIGKIVYNFLYLLLHFARDK